MAWRCKGETAGGDEPARTTHSRILLLANPENRRVEFFQAALARFDLPPAIVLPYADLLAERLQLGEFLRPGTMVRIESPGEDFEVEKALVAAGAEAACEEGSPWLAPEDVQRLSFDRGLILSPRQWYLGYRTFLRKLAAELAEHEDIRVLNPPSNIEVMFDKPLCHARCAAAGLPVPRALAPVGSYEELLARMTEAGLRRVFVKLANGSSASGVVALACHGPRQQAITSAELVRGPDGVRLYNSLRIRCYRDSGEIALLINTLCRQRVHVEEWLPKAGMEQGVFDLRIVVIGGMARHAVVRQSRGPLTNLHLGNRRGNLKSLLDRLGPRRWAEVRETCTRVMGLFPGSLYAGIDVCLLPNLRRHAILEVNAFGDLLPGVLCEGMDTYEAEVAAILQ